LGVEPVGAENDRFDEETLETPLGALEAVIRPCLLRPPCLVSFSGGRDSAAVLATATALAAREGVPSPIPATIAPVARSANETEWQEQIVRHLRLDEWVRIAIDDELDAVGPVATRVLRTHGLLWPFNTHLHAPLLAAARGGSLLTGIGGDELFSTSPSRLALVLAGQARPELRDVARLAVAITPQSVSRAIFARRMPMDFPWLRPEARRELRRAWGAQAAAEPHDRRSQIHWLRRLRSFRIGLSSLQLLAEEERVSLVHPFATRRAGAAVASAGGRLEPRDRTAAMQSIFADLLPPAVVDRVTKAVFDEVFWHRHSREYAARWDGTGLDEELVDVDVLRELWSSPRPPGQTFTLLQAAWLASEERRHPVSGESDQ
jgi:asparagine synthetase B (glutamine-hydrolysing)